MYDLQHILSADKPDFDAMTKEEVMYWVGSCDILLQMYLWKTYIQAAKEFLPFTSYLYA